MSTETLPHPTVVPSRAWHYALWTVQILLALPFLAAAAFKLTAPIDDLAVAMSWVDNFPAAVVRFIAVSELLGAIGLIVPAATRIRPVLTAWAAVGLFTIMALAIPVHLLDGDPSPLPVNLILGSLAAFVAWGRFVKAPIPAR